MKYLLVAMLFLMTLQSCETTKHPVVRTTTTKIPPVVERNDFESLMAKDKLDKNQRSAAVVTQLINDAPGDKVAAIVLENKTNCNIIVKISGMKNYLLPIYKNDKNFLIVDKGNYTFSSGFCRAKYYAEKNITESVTITLSEH